MGIGACPIGGYVVEFNYPHGDTDREDLCNQLIAEDSIKKSLKLIGIDCGHEYSNRCDFFLWVAPALTLTEDVLNKALNDTCYSVRHMYEIKDK